MFFFFFGTKNQIFKLKLHTIYIYTFNISIFDKYSGIQIVFKLILKNRLLHKSRYRISYQYVIKLIYLQIIYFISKCDNSFINIIDFFLSFKPFFKYIILCVNVDYSSLCPSTICTLFFLVRLTIISTLQFWKLFSLIRWDLFPTKNTLITFSLCHSLTLPILQ